MAFVLEFVQWTIAKTFEPEVKQRENEERLNRIHKGAQDVKEQWQIPTKPADYWKSKRAQAKYQYDSQPGLSKLYGRRGPYEDYNLD